MGRHGMRLVCTAFFLIGFVGRSTGVHGAIGDTCVDFRGLTVVSVSDRHIQDVSVATLLADGSPVIYFNPALMLELHPKTRMFFHAHECGHHVLGHLPKMVRAGSYAPAIEQEADCYGIRTMVQARQANDHDVAVIQSDLARLGLGDWDHLPGSMRAINLRKCLGGHPFAITNTRFGFSGATPAR